MERAIKEKDVRLPGNGDGMPHDLINAKPVMARFASSSGRRSSRSS